MYRGRDESHALLVPAVHSMARKVPAIPHRVMSDRDVASAERASERACQLAWLLTQPRVVLILASGTCETGTPSEVLPTPCPNPRTPDQTQNIVQRLNVSRSICGPRSASGRAPRPILWEAGCATWSPDPAESWPWARASVLLFSRRCLSARV